MIIGTGTASAVAVVDNIERIASDGRVQYDPPLSNIQQVVPIFSKFRTEPILELLHTGHNGSVYYRSGIRMTLPLRRRRILFQRVCH